jgi:CO/xanthine dehydrogenase Mo-binding subunit
MAHDVIGKPSPNLIDYQVLTGKAHYLNDLQMDDVLVGKLLYSKYPCALIKKIDVSKAEDLPGVIAVLTHKDIPGENSFLLQEADQPVLMEDRVNYVGDAIAAVAAETEEAAQAGLDAIDVVYEPLPGVFSIDESMKDDVSEVLPRFENIIPAHLHERGDLEAGFQEADVIIENTYQSQWIEHAYLEPEGALSYLDPEGNMVVYASNQAPNRDRKQIARSLGIPEHKVRVITPYVGGAFGAKDEIHVQIHTALLTQATGKPVKILRTREESIRTHVKRHPIRVEHKLGATKDGVITAASIRAIADTGPYMNAGLHVMWFVGTVAGGPYYLPNVRVESLAVRTNNPIGGAMRGFGGPQVALAYEAQMDELAKVLDMDPVEVRRVNAIQSGQVTPDGSIVRNADAVPASIDEAVQMIAWESRHKIERQPASHLRRGWGLATTWFVIGLGRGQDNAGVIVEMAPDGSVVIRTGAVEMGQGVFTALGAIVAENLGIDLGSIRIISPDTDITPDAMQTAASRQTFMSGNAINKASQVIRTSLLETAAEETGLPIEILDLKKGRLYAEGEVLSVSIPELADKATYANRPMFANGFYVMDFPEEKTKEGTYYGVGPSAFGTQIAQVLVDIETGEVQVEKLIAAQNVGKIINYGGAYGQMEGGCIMGTGYALMEDLVVKDGNIVTESLESYLIPTALDVPETKIKLLEIPEPFGPFGAVGIGEPSMMGTAPAIANAVSDAIGVRMTQIPLTPERVLAAIEGEYNE